MKKVLSIILAVVLVASMTVIAVNAYSTFDEGALTVKQAVTQYEEENETEVPTYRYYFLMPDGKTGLKGKNPESEFYGQFAPSWFHSGTEEDPFNYTEFGPAAYWWDALSCPNPTAWVGYTLGNNVEGTTVYYADVPVNVTTIIFNNGVDGGTDSTLPIYYLAAQTVNQNAEYYEEGDSEYGITCDSFDGMIYVIEPDIVSISDFSQKQTCGGSWLYYYGGDCFGCVEGGESDLEANCMNAAHHHGQEPSTDESTEGSTGSSETTHEFILGDANKDGYVDVLDATTIQKYLAYLVSEDDIDLEAADVTGQGVDILSATTIQKYLAYLTNIDGTKPYDPDYPKNPII